MVNVIDSLNITGMMQTDFIQLKEIFEHHKEDGSYWGRKDLWDKRMIRLEEWLTRINQSLIGAKIPKEYSSCQDYQINITHV